MINMCKLIKYNKIYLLTFFFLSTDFQTNVYYGIFLFFLVLFLLKYGLRPFFVASYKEDFIARTFFLVWLYGFLLGFIFGNKTEYIIANFAGMICYLVYFIFVRLKIDIDKAIKITYVSGFILSIYAIISILSFLFGFGIPFLESNLDLASTGQFRIFFSNLGVVYPLFATSLGYFLFNRANLPQLVFPKFLFLLTFIVLFLVSASKGYVLGGLYVLGTIFAFSTFNSIRDLRIKPTYILVIILGLILYMVLEDLGYIEIIDKIFDSNDESNIERYDQLYFMIKELDFIGHGLGATIAGTIRSEKSPYGFELVYVNLIHKFGISSLFLFYGWLYMFIRSFKYFKNPITRKYGIFLIGSLGYLFPALGNPSLMHPSLVFLNSLALYILRQLNQDGKRIVNKTI